MANILSCKLDTNKDHHIQVLLKLECVGRDKKRDIRVAAIEGTTANTELSARDKLVIDKAIYLNKIAKSLEKFRRRALSDKARFRDWDISKDSIITFKNRLLIPIEEDIKLRAKILDKVHR